MKKQTVKSLTSVKSRVSRNISKDLKKSFKLVDFTEFKRVLLFCKNQNEIIDLFAYQKQTLQDCIAYLVISTLCKSTNHAASRVSRHVKKDNDTFINTRLANLFERAQAKVVQVVEIEA
jgi:hypothetical protein